MSKFEDLARAHAWAPLSILVMLWIYRMLSDDSKFPITWPAGWIKWKPMVIITLGQGICVTKAIAIDHAVWYVATEHGVIISFMALGGIHVLRNWWPEGQEPKWLKMIVLVFSRVADVAVVTAAKEEEAITVPVLPEDAKSLDDEIEAAFKHDAKSAPTLPKR